MVNFVLNSRSLELLVDKKALILVCLALTPSSVIVFVPPSNLLEAACFDIFLFLRFFCFDAVSGFFTNFYLGNFRFVFLFNSLQVLIGGFEFLSNSDFSHTICMSLEIDFSTFRHILV